MRWRRLEWAIVVVLSLVLLGGAASATTDPLATGQRGGVRVSLAGMKQHLAVFQRIASRNGRNRMAGTKGYDESARYVAGRMRAAGYRVRLQEFEFPFVVDRSPPALRALGGREWGFRANRDYATLAYSGSDRVEAPVAAVDLLVPSPSANASTSGCEATDFRGFPRGAVALLQRGTCTFRVKVANAIDAGARAVVLANEGNAGRTGLFAGTLGTPQVGIPALAANFAVGETLRNGVRDGATGITVTLTTDMVAERKTTRNVIAESRSGSPGNVVVVGAHLDSVEHGPGINDNGSGSAVILEVAEQMANVRPANRLRFVWWGAEELGLLGSRHYVDGLSAEARRWIALYLNFDMVGSPNFVRFVYDGDGSASRRGGSAPPAGSAAIEQVFRRYFASRNLPYREVGMGGRSDHAPFVQAGIPVGGLFTGADGRKSAAEAARFGGRSGEPYDSCYHRSCDTLANVNGTALSEMGQAVAHAVTRFGRDTSMVRRR